MNSTFSIEEYNAVIADIFTRFPSVQKTEFSKAYKPGLESITKMMERLDNPQDKYRTIHIAGTNGKGSVSSMLASILSKKLRVGLFTSPHLLDFRERIKIIQPKLLSNSKSVDSELDKDSQSSIKPTEIIDDFECSMISREDVWKFLVEKRPDFDALDLSFFEIATAMAFSWFADQNVDVAIMETGMGGRLDSTNIIIPDLSIVTNIGLDHCSYLGSTIGDIAREKAGIFKKGVSTVIGETNSESASVFNEVYQSLNSTLEGLKYADRVFSEGQSGKDFYDVVLCGVNDEAILENMDLKGEYQSHNLHTVLVSLNELLSINYYKDIFYNGAMQNNNKDAILNAARRTGLHARWEKVSEKPLMICDIGHNAAALKYNFGQLKKMMLTGEYDKLIIIYGIMKDKDFDEIIPYMPLNAEYIFTKPDTLRALDAEKIEEQFLLKVHQDIDISKIHTGSCGTCTILPKTYTTSSVSSALMKESEIATERSLVYIGGSTFVVSDFLSEFSNHF